uniref:Uncharacterized protein n=1 Tax=Caenorhabditis japonica TaxID=281687 RepID=A0A8R1EIK8_CAEJA
MNDQDTKTEVKAHTRKRQQASTITRPPSARKHQADRTAPDKHQPTGQPFRPLEPILFPKAVQRARDTTETAVLFGNNVPISG